MEEASVGLLGGRPDAWGESGQQPWPLVKALSWGCWLGICGDTESHGGSPSRDPVSCPELRQGVGGLAGQGLLAGGVSLGSWH